MFVDDVFIIKKREIHLLLCLVLINYSLVGSINNIIINQSINQLIYQSTAGARYPANFLWECRSLCLLNYLSIKERDNYIVSLNSAVFSKIILLYFL